MQYHCFAQWQGGGLVHGLAAIDVFLYDFDPTTGTFANYRFQWSSGEMVTGISFSPDNSKLYVTTARQQPCGDTARLYQFDFNAANLVLALVTIPCCDRGSV
jgi:DNA-binding beta-propeller fold protein YncE